MPESTKERAEPAQSPSTIQPDARILLISAEVQTQGLVRARQELFPRA